MDFNAKRINFEENFHQCDVRRTSTKVIIWKIPDYIEMHRTLFKLDSPPFFFQDAEWCLRIYPKKSCSARGDDFIRFIIIRLSTPARLHKLNVILKGDYITETSFVLAFDEENDKEEDTKILLRCKTVRLREFENGLILICEISADALSQTEFLMQDKKDKDVATLCQNFKDLLLYGQNHDVVLKVKNEEFHAHQDILRARSPVFESMLNHDMIEKTSGVIDIPDCDPRAFEQFLYYLYCAKLESLDTDNMLALYYIADKYNMEGLKEECREFIKRSLSSSNITHVIEVASNHSDAGLLQRATDYFVEEVNEILPTVEWLSFMKCNTTQANELIIKAVKKLSDRKA